MSQRTEIEDGQSAMPEPYSAVRIEPDPLIIRASVVQRLDGTRQAICPRLYVSTD